MFKSKNVFTSLCNRMLGFGIAIGIFFPFFSTILGVDRSISFSFLYFVSCICAGLIVGIINFFIAKVTVGRKLTELKEKMVNVSQRVSSVSFQNQRSECTLENCLIEESSTDEFGDSANAFNNLVESLITTLNSEDQHRQFIKKVALDLDLNAIASAAMRMLLSYSKSNGGSIIVEKEGELVNIASCGIKRPKALIKNSIINEAIKSGKRQIVRFPDYLNLDGVLAEFRPTEIVIEPILLNSIPIGMILLASVASFTTVFLDQLDIYSHDFSLIINNALQHEQLEQMAALDPLTGVYNRRFGLERLKSEFNRAIRNASSLGVIMIDIDRFKVINDTYGHTAGDRFLKHLTTICIPILRNGDILMRYGGEEFLAILPGASKDDVYKIAERIRYAVGQSEIDYTGSRISATISLGIDSYPETSITDFNTLIKNADSALYKAKNTGRNKTIVFE